MLISVHIPRCGGASFRRALEEIYGKERVQVRHGDPVSRGWVPWRTACVHGQFPSHSFDHKYPDASLVTWLRHPVERLVSQYHQFRRQPDWTHPACQALRERRLTLEEFSALPSARNEMGRFLGSKPLQAFHFVGILERSADSLRLFGETFGRAVAADLPRHNANPERDDDPYYLTEGLREHIETMNQSDLDLYESAVALLESRLRQASAQASRGRHRFGVGAMREA
jgi:hypothetical protein